jgi:hypothetical protein
MDAGGIMVAGEREMVPRIKPAVVGGAKRVKGTQFDHGVSPVG